METTSNNIEKSTDTEQSSKSQSGQPTEHTQLIQRILIEGTPFTAIKVDEKWFLAFQKYRLTETLETFEECKDQALHDQHRWDRILQIVQIMIDYNWSTKWEGMKDVEEIRPKNITERKIPKT